MTYLWQKFNIKTFPAETIVFANGKYQSDLSTLPNDLKIDKKYDLPVHIIYIGEIAGKNNINIEITSPDQQVFFSSMLEIKKDAGGGVAVPAFLNIFIKNAGKNSNFMGKILVNNESDLKIDIFGTHFEENTGLFVENRIIGHENSTTKLSGLVKIENNAKNCKSDIKFSAILVKNAKIQFMPAQNINSIPESAEHSANIYRFDSGQVEYLRTAGLSMIEIQNVLQESFTNGFV
jgi:hypothetical protein